MKSDILFRHFENEADLELQYQFWQQITAEMDYAWKLTTSPTQFYDSDSFDPKTRYFAFEDEKLVGYMSFTAHGSFISLGYPWVLPGYEEIREELWNDVYSYAIGEYGGEVMTQRFRSQWKEQIEFFTERGFEITNENPILILDLQSLSYSELPEPTMELTIHSSFSTDDYIELLRSFSDIPEEAELNTRIYFDTIKFDHVLKIAIKDKTIALIGATHRKDTNFSEMIAFSFNPEYEDQFVKYIVHFFKHLKEEGVNQVAITLSKDHELIEFFTDLGFVHKSNDVYVELRLK